MTLGPDIAILCHYDPEGAIRPDTVRYLRELREAGFDRVVVSNRRPSAEAAVAIAAESEAAHVRCNIGMDFGAWRMALRRLNLPRPNTRRILLINDSVYGPIVPLQPFLERMDTDAADLWGMTDSREIAWHVQSFFLLAGPRLVHSATWRRFWATAVPVPWRRWVIRRHEIGFSRRVVADGFTARALFPARSGANPMFADWRELLRDGFPFLKRELLRDNPTADPGIAAWRQLVAEPFVREIERDLGRWKKS